MAQSILIAPTAPSRPATWPREWASQCVLLERQHDRLESLLAVLIDDHSADDNTMEQALQRACRRLLWDLRLHLRLEERWLQQRGCLCPGHTQDHREIASQTRATLTSLEHDRQGRLALLESIQSWFLAHRQGADARAYGLAAQT